MLGHIQSCKPNLVFFTYIVLFLVPVCMYGIFYSQQMYVPTLSCRKVWQVISCRTYIISSTHSGQSPQPMYNYPTFIATCTYTCLLYLCLLYLPYLLYLHLVYCAYTLSPVPTLPPVPIYSPLCLTQCLLPIVLFLASYAYASTLSPVLFYCNRLKCCSSNSPITARHARATTLE